MRLAVFIRKNIEIILQEWEDFAVTLSPLNNASKKQLQDHAKAMLLVICKDLETFQGVQEGIEKSKGNAPEASQDTAAELHAVGRMDSGLTVEELMAEYRVLRASVLRLWQIKSKEANEFDLQDMLRFNEAIDQSLTESIARYSVLVRDSQNVFLAILGHDVRNPLGAISMGSQLLLHDDELALKHVRVAKQIRRSVDRVSAIVSDLLDFSTTHLGSGIPVTLASMDFHVECTAIVDEIRMFYPDKNIRLGLEGNLTAYWDRTRIGQALSNLVANAVHHGLADTAIWITVTENGDAIQWAIRNEGAVICPEELRFMFDPGKRFSIKPCEERSAFQDGHLGLGLYITRAIVEAHNGVIRITSTAQEGTTFTIRIPRGQVPDA